MIIKRKYYVFLSVFIMFSIVQKTFGMARMQVPPVGATREVNLSGNSFSFSMPENFSRDMPAEAMVEQFNINSAFKETPLIQRWWDIRKPGFFGSNIGTVMMSINVVPVPNNSSKLIHDKPYNIRDRVDLMQLVIETLKLRYQDENGTLNELYSIPGLAYLFGAEISGEFRESVFNQQKWTSYSVTGPGAQLIVSHVLPLSDSAYLEASFIYSPNDGVFPREFLDYAYKTTDLVEKSFHLDFAKNNPMEETVEKDWMNSTANQALEDNREVIIPKLFGPEHLKIQNQ